MTFVYPFIESVQASDQPPMEDVDGVQNVNLEEDASASFPTVTGSQHRACLLAACKQSP